MADGRHAGKYWKCYNMPTDGPIGTKLGGRIQPTPLLQNRFPSIGRFC